MTRPASLPRRPAGVVAILTIAVASTIAGARAADPTPRGVHIAYGADSATQMSIVWHTRGVTPVPTVVQYGPTEALGTTVSGTSLITTGLPNSLASRLHEVRLTGLQSDTPYHYRVGDGASAWSPIRTFRTATPNDESQRFVVFGDHGTSPAAAATVEVVRSLDPDFVLIAGDVSYANSRLERWDTWAELVEPLAAEVPIMAAPGNHETDTSQTPTPAAFLERFAFPGAELFYGFDVGRVHVLMLHSTINSLTARQYAEQISYAEADLLAASMRRDAGALDRIIVVQHHPLYGSQDTTDHERTFNAPMIAWEERMLHQYDVDVLIAGHNHHYERTTPVAYGQPAGAVDGFVEVITGGAGAGLYGFKQSGIAPWSAVRAQRFHVMLVELTNDVFRFTAVATDGTGDILDTFEVAAT